MLIITFSMWHLWELRECSILFVWVLSLLWQVCSRNLLWLLFVRESTRTAVWAIRAYHVLILCSYFCVSSLQLHSSVFRADVVSPGYFRKTGILMFKIKLKSSNESSCFVPSFLSLPVSQAHFENGVLRTGKYPTLGTIQVCKLQNHRSWDLGPSYVPPHSV